MAIVSVINPDGTPVDFSQVTPWDGESGSLTPGNYIFEVTEVAQEMSSNNKPQLVLHLVVINGDTQIHNGQNTMHWISLTAKAAGRYVNFLQAIGIDFMGPVDDQDFLGRQFQGEVFEQPYTVIDPIKGPIVKTRNKIRKETPIEGAAAQAAPAPAPPPATAPARVVAPARALPPQARGAAVLPRPGQRVPMPGTRK